VILLDHVVQVLAGSHRVRADKFYSHSAWSARCQERIHGRRVFSRGEEFARSVASLTDVKSALWELCFPGTGEDSTSNLQTWYETAQLQQRARISELLPPMLADNADTIPEWYAAIFSLPWHKCYTLNIDDLDAAVSRAFDLPRKIEPVSVERAMTWKVSSEALEVVHLNGTLADIPDDITFSASQYAERLLPRTGSILAFLNAFVVR
jgi:hypothetical protein